jgi:hypothetical protein
MSDVFNGSWNLMDDMSNVVVHEWVHDFNISLENLTFQTISTSIKMHFYYLETSLYVHVICFIF